jgi:hypothetical protein
MRMARRRFWRPGEDDPVPGVESAYEVAQAALEKLRGQIARTARARSEPGQPAAAPAGAS